MTTTDDNLDEQLAQALTEMKTNINYLMTQVRLAAARGAGVEALLDCIGTNVPPLQRALLAGVVVGASGLDL
jgi:hypothetical protein